MEFIGLIGLIGLLGFLGKSGIQEKIDEVKSDVTKNNEQIESRVKNIEKIAADANRKAQDISNENQHFATKIDADNLSKRLDAVEKNSNDDAKVAELEDKFNSLQKHSEEVAQANSDLQQNLKNFEDKHFDETLQNLGGSLQTLTDNFKTLDEGIKTFDESLKTFDGRLKNLEDSRSADEDNKFEERLGTIEEEQKDFNKKVEDYNTVIQKHHVALVQWKNNFVAIQNSFNAVQSNFDEHKKFFVALQSRLDAQEKIIDDFKSKFNTQDSLIDSFQQNFDENKKTLSALQSHLNEQGGILDDFKSKFAAHGSLLDSFQKNIAEFEKICESLKGNTYLTIENFDIKPTGRIFFTNKPDEVFHNLKIASNLTGITSFLESSNFNKKENFIRIVENYRQNLKKVTDKVRRKKFNEDALSEEITEAFFNTLSKFFLATIPISIYRGARQETLENLDENIHEEEFKFYSAFLTKINEYLAACQIYTMPVLPKNLMTSEDVDRMSVTRKETANEAEDNMIDEVERLPYYMDYLTEGGETENFCSEGKMVVLKFDGGAQ